MDVHLSPDLEARVRQWIAETGRTADELAEDAFAGYFAEMALMRETLDRRYDEIKSGKVQLLDGEEVIENLKAEIETKRRRRA